MKHIDKLFKERLHDHEVLVPEGMWEKIAPIAEEESGRALLWFWFAGILALLIGGYGIYKLTQSADDTPQDPGTLVYKNENSISQIESPQATLALNDLESVSTPATSDSESDIKEDRTSETTNVNPIEKTVKKAKKATLKIKSQDQSIDTKKSISNTVENISNAEGIPVDLVITKSYISKEGSVIRQSNLTDNSGNEEPVYDVIINSEAKELNAGALLRIVEPLENIPLPGFQKTLKKKTLSPRL